MKINMAVWDQILRMVVGLILTAWAIAGGPWWAYLGLGLLATAAWRFCPLYSLLRIGTYRASARDSTKGPPPGGAGKTRPDLSVRSAKKS